MATTSTTKAGTTKPTREQQIASLTSQAKALQTSLNKSVESGQIKGGKVVNGRVVSTEPKASPMTPDAMTPATPVNIPATPTIPNLPDVKSLNIGLGAGTDGTFTAPTTTQTTTQDNFGAIEDWKAKAFSQIYQDYGSGQARMSKLEKDMQLEKKQAAVNKYQNQLNSIIAQRDQNLVSVEGQGRGIPEPIILGQQYQIKKEAFLEAAPVQAALAAAQGDYETAQQRVNKLFEVQSQDALMQFNFRTKVIESIAETATKSEQRRLDEISKQEERKYQEQLDFIKTQSDAYARAVAQQAPASVLNAILSAKDTVGVYAAAGQYNGDVLARQIRLANLNKLNQVSTGYAKPDIQKINGVDMQWNAATGKWETPNVPEGPVAQKPKTQQQILAQGFADRATASSSVIDQVGGYFTGGWSYVGEKMPNIFKSEDRQKFEQAKRDFVNAILRRESGANISPSEFDSAEKQYFPVPGDSAGVVTQKAANRASVIRNLNLAANAPTLQPVDYDVASMLSGATPDDMNDILLLMNQPTN